jgi:hypothetical protein
MSQVQGKQQQWGDGKRVKESHITFAPLTHKFFDVLWSWS